MTDIYDSEPTATTKFEYRSVPLTKWFVAIDLTSADKCGISAPRLSKMIGVQHVQPYWPLSSELIIELTILLTCTLNKTIKNHGTEQDGKPC